MATESGTTTEKKVQTEVSPEVRTGLVALFQARERSFGDGTVNILRFILNNGLNTQKGRNIVKEILVDEIGLKEGSATTQTSYMFSLLKDDNKAVFEQLVKGELTVDQARAAVTKKRRAKPEGQGEPSEDDKYKGGLNNLAKYALDKGKKLEEFVQDATSAYNEQVKVKAQNEANAEQLAQKRAAQAPAQSGSIEATPAKSKKTVAA